MAGTRVKICGLTRRADVAAAVEHGAWAVGFVLWPGSPRAVPLSKLRTLVSDVPEGVKRVGVVVDATLEVALRLRDAGLTTLQLHGGEDVELFFSLEMELVKAVSLQSDADAECALALPPEVTVLVDAHDPVRRGGTGERADWSRAAALSARRSVILAGGLRAQNVEDAIAQVSPWGIDVSSGVESAPGIKDLAKMDHFFAIVAETSRRP